MVLIWALPCLLFFQIYFLQYTERTWVYFVYGATAPQWARASYFTRFLDHTPNDAPQSVRLHWTSDQLVAQTSIWQHTTLTTDRHIHAPGEIRNHNLGRRAAADPRLRPRYLCIENFKSSQNSGIFWICRRYCNYHERITSIKNVIEEFNNIYCALNLTTEEENEKSLNFLDVTLKRIENHINISVFWIPTTKDYIIPRELS
jgi:hypothetical protein